MVTYSLKLANYCAGTFGWTSINARDEILPCKILYNLVLYQPQYFFIEMLRFIFSLINNIVLN